MFLYSVYGLQLQANLPIPGLVALPATPGADVEVSLGSMPPCLGEMLGAAQIWYSSSYLDERGEPALTVWKMADGRDFRFRYTNGTEFIINRLGTQVWAGWPDKLTLEDTATYLLGPVLGFVLLLRGVICLHASAIAVGDQAIALLGPAGAGKSTTAATFARLGYPVLSEDVLALTNQGNGFLVQPGYPRLRLWPESVNALCGAPDALPRLTPTWDKRYLDLMENGYRFQQQPLLLAAIYILGERRADPAAPFVEAVPANAALITLVANSYATRLMDKAMRGEEFDLLGRVVANVPLRRVNPHADVALLSKLCDVILDDFKYLPLPAPS